MNEFLWDEHAGLYSFETPRMKGTLVPQGKFQGIHSLIHKEEGRERVGVFTRTLSPEAIAAYGDLTGKRLFLLDLYHYLARNLQPGIKGRDMTARHRIVAGGVEITFDPKPPCQVHTKAVYAITGPEQIDLEIQVTAEEDYPDFELWLSSYTPSRANGAYFYPCDGAPMGGQGGQGHFVRPQAHELYRGYYLCFPRDNRAAALTYDGRWGDDRYQTFVTASYYAAPIAVVRNHDTGYAYIEMGQKKTCPKVCGSYIDPAIDPKIACDYTPIYTVLFGCDLVREQMLTARVRACLVKMGDDFDVPLELYREFEGL